MLQIEGKGTEGTKWAGDERKVNGNQTRKENKNYFCLNVTKEEEFMGETALFIYS